MLPKGSQVFFTKSKKQSGIALGAHHDRFVFSGYRHDQADDERID